MTGLTNRREAERDVGGTGGGGGLAEVGNLKQYWMMMSGTETMGK